MYVFCFILISLHPPLAFLHSFPCIQRHIRAHCFYTHFEWSSYFVRQHVTSWGDTALHCRRRRCCCCCCCYRSNDKRCVDHRLVTYTTELTCKISCDIHAVVYVHGCRARRIKTQPSSVWCVIISLCVSLVWCDIALSVKCTMCFKVTILLL